MHKGRVLLLLFFIIIISGVFIFAKEKTQPLISPIPENTPAKVLGIFSKKKNPEDLKERIQSTIGDSLKNYSVYVADYHSDFLLGINETEIFNAASVNKLPILAALYSEAQKGNVDFDKVITLQEEDIQDYGTGSIRYDPPGTTYSVKTLAQLMMKKSDNTAAFILANYVVSLSKIQSIINSWGLTQTDMVNNKTSNKDMEILLRKIYNNKVTSTAATIEMLGFMRDSDFENRIPGNLPKDVMVYHKIGSGDTGEVHDVGVVQNGKITYYIGILTTDTNDIDATSKLEAKISKVVYDFMK